MTIKQQIISDLIDRFPSAGSRTLARIALRENPAVFTDLDTARYAIRYQRGAAGDVNRKKNKSIARHRPPQTPRDPFAAIPDGKTEFQEWGPFQMEGPMRALILSDIHFPYHDRGALLVAMKHGRERKANTVILNGDTMDFYSVSFWEKDPRKRNFAEELKTGREFIQALRECFPRARIVFKLGNHEERLERYMRVKAPELLGIEAMEISALIGLDGIETVSEKRPIRLGQLNVLHGHEYRFAISNPVNPARGLFLRAKAHALCGHFHQSSYHADKNVEQKNVACWSTGCLCDMHPEYAPFNNWGHGFAFVEVARDGKFEVRNHFIAGGKVY